MTYCAEDVRSTHEVFGSVLPAALSACPHPASFAGMTAMAKSYLPVDESWRSYLRDAEGVFQRMNEASVALALCTKCARRLTDVVFLPPTTPTLNTHRPAETARLHPAYAAHVQPHTCVQSGVPACLAQEVTQELERLAEEALQLTESRAWEGDPWLSQLDWEVVPQKYGVAGLARGSHRRRGLVEGADAYPQWWSHAPATPSLAGSQRPVTSGTAATPREASPGQSRASCFPESPSGTEICGAERRRAWL